MPTTILTTYMRASDRPYEDKMHTYETLQKKVDEIKQTIYIRRLECKTDIPNHTNIGRNHEGMQRTITVA